MIGDYHLDPPESPEPPECCGDLMDLLEDGAAVCLVCGRIEEPLPDIDPVEFEDPFPEELGYPQEVTCRHGNPLGDCDHCDFLADIAYDEKRERGMR